MIRLGAAVERLSVEQYGAFHAGKYQEQRDWLLHLARTTTDHEMRCTRIRNAISAHRSMMRTMREARRDQLARGGVV